MTFDQALPVVQEIMESLSDGERARVLTFFKSPKAEPLKESAALKLKSKRDGPHVDNRDKTITMAVSSGKI